MQVSNYTKGALSKLEPNSHRYKIEKDREIRILQNSWNEEQARLNREIRTLQTRLDALPDEISKATRAVRQERDQLLIDERRKSGRLQEKAQEDYDRHVSLVEFGGPSLVNKSTVGFSLVSRSAGTGL